MRFAIVTNITGIVVREFDALDDYAAPSHKFGPDKPERVVRVVEVQPPAIEAGQEIQRAPDELTETELLRGWVAVAKPVPQEVPMWALREACASRNHTAQIDAALAGLPEPTRVKAMLRWEYKDTISRGSSMIASMQSLLGWTNAYVDELFVAADTLAKS